MPQAVLDKDGRVLDIDLVLGEAAPDGGELVVEYGSGPLAFDARRAPLRCAALAELCSSLLRMMQGHNAPMT